LYIKRAISGIILLSLVILITLYTVKTLSFNLQGSSSGSLKALIVEDALPFGMSRAIEEALEELGISYEIVSSSDFASVDLSKYKMIIIPSDQPTSYYNNMLNYIDELRDFVLGGKVIVAHMTDMGLNGGTWTQSFLPCALDLRHVNLQINDLTIINYQHPVINGPYGTVTDESIDNWYFSAHGYFTNIPRETNIVIGCADDPITMPVYIEWRCGHGLILATMMPLEWAWEWGYTGGVIMLKNELIYAYDYNPLLIGGDIITSSKRNMVKNYDYVTTSIVITTLMILYISTIWRQKRN